MDYTRSATKPASSLVQPTNYSFCLLGGTNGWRVACEQASNRERKAVGQSRGENEPQETAELTDELYASLVDQTTPRVLDRLYRYDLLVIVELIIRRSNPSRPKPSSSSWKAATQ